MTNLTAETRRRGENFQKPTAEAQRHGERSENREIGGSESLSP
jgi:hypothetical protein